MPFPLSCTSTPDTSTGSVCQEPTAGCLGCFPRYEGARSTVQIGEVRVYDGGQDGIVATDDGETLFAKQGVFVP